MFDTEDEISTGFSEESDKESDDKTHSVEKLDSKVTPKGQIDENANIKKKLTDKPTTSGNGAITTSKSHQADRNDKFPGTRTMITKALNFFNDRRGTSLQAIKKYILQHYPDFDMQRNGRFIVRMLRKVILEGDLKQIKGKYKLIQKPKNNITKKKIEPTANKKTAEYKNKNPKIKMENKVADKTKAIVHPEIAANTKKKNKVETKTKKEKPMKEVMEKEATSKAAPALKKNSKEKPQKLPTVPMLKGRTSLTMPAVPKKLKKTSSKSKLEEVAAALPKLATSTPVIGKLNAKSQETPKRRRKV